MNNLCPEKCKFNIWLDVFVSLLVGLDVAVAYLLGYIADPITLAWITFSVAIAILVIALPVWAVYLNYCLPQMSHLAKKRFYMLMAADICTIILSVILLVFVYYFSVIALCVVIGLLAVAFCLLIITFIRFLIMIKCKQIL